MPTPQFIEQKAFCLVDVKTILEKIEKRDTALNHLSAKTKEYVEQSVDLSHKKKEELVTKLADLQLTRLKDEHITKMVDFLPTTANDLKIVLQAYPLSLPKKDQDSIVAVVQEVVK